MTCPEKYDLKLTDSGGEAHGLILDWGRGGAGLSMERQNSIQSTAVSTKGNFGVRDSADHFRIIQTDWSEGSGQPTYDRETDSESAFDWSKNIDVSVPGTFRLGPKVSLSDQVTDPLPATMLPAIIAHGRVFDSVTPTVLAAFTDATTAENRLAFSMDGDTWYSTGATGPPASPVSFATDGENLYMALTDGVNATDGAVYVSDGISGCATFSSHADNAHITHVAFTAGYLYAAKGGDSDDALLGAFDSSTPAEWQQLTPTEGEAINAAGTTFGLVDAGSYVYWGVTNGLVTKVMKCRWSSTPANVVLQTVATFPTGFVGASMCSYLGTVYVGGHYDWTTPDTGVGSIYAIVGDNPVRLLDIGQRENDNRVLAMAAYEKNLYFVSGSEIWRWDLVAGGYTHFAGPLDSTPVTVYNDIVWAAQYDMTAAFGTEVEAIVGDAGVRYGEEIGVVTGYKYAYTYATGKTASIEVTIGQAGDMTADQTLEFDIPPYGLEAISNTDVCYVGIRNGVRSAKITMYGKEFGDYGCALASGDVTLQNFTLDQAIYNTIRLTLEGSKAKAYANGVLVASGTTTATSGDQNIYWGVDNVAILGSATKADTAFYLDEIRWVTGVYDPTLVTDATASGIGLACFRDRVVAACSGYGAVYTDPTHYAVDSSEGVSPSITFSRSSGNMPTVEKYFSAVHVNLEYPLPEDTTLTAVLTIDGTTMVMSEDATSTDYLKVYLPDAVSAQGRLERLQFLVGNTDEDVTPVITEVAVLFDPMPKAPKLYTYFVRCWDEVESRTPGQEWDENARVVADWLEETAGAVVTVERVGQDSYTGRIEGLSYMEAPPSGRANGREGLYQVSIRKV